MSAAQQKTAPCAVCHQEIAEEDLTPLELVRDNVIDTIVKRHPDVTKKGAICEGCLNQARAEYVEDVLEEERGELSQLETDLVKSMQEEELVARDINKEFDTSLSFGERLADKMADYAGSWTFIGIFSAVLILWITFNSIALLRKPFDPFPYILLNLALSCLAAIQAPVIMMSQNRQEFKDRLRAEEDYRVNLKAELEIRHLHQKLDHLICHQWERLTEIQEAQMEMMARAVNHHNEPGQPPAAEKTAGSG